jgi:predicted RNase H-like nuclease (RuvC/YqgF family)
MNRDLLLEKLAEKMASDHSSDISNDAFLIIMKTIHTILDHQIESSEQQESIIEKIDSILSNQETALTKIDQLKAELDKLQNKQVETLAILHDYFVYYQNLMQNNVSIQNKIQENANSLMQLNTKISNAQTEIETLTANDGRWKKFWMHVTIYLVAIGTVFTIGLSIGIIKLPWMK